MFAQTIRYDSENRAMADNRELMVFQLLKVSYANDSSPMIVMMIGRLKAVFEPGTPADVASGMPVLSATSQGSPNTNTALPPTFDGFLKQNAAQEKTSESLQTVGVLAVVLLGVISLCRWWFLRR